MRRSRCSCFPRDVWGILIVNKVQVQPHFMMATLIFWTEAQGFVGNCASSMQTDFPVFTRVRWLYKTTYVSPPGTATGAHDGVEPGGIGKFVSVKASSITLRLPLPQGRRQAAPLKYPATKSTCSSNITARIVSSSFVVALLGMIVVDVQRHHCAERFATAWLPAKTCP